MRIFNIPLLRIVPDDTKFDFMRFRRISFPISALLSILAIIFFFHPGLNLGIDFKGGTLLEIQDKSGAADLAKMRTTLGITGLLPRFEGRLFSATEVAHGKPAPDLFLHAAARCGVTPDACLLVEDAPAGVIGGRAAGMTVCGYAGHSPAHRLREAGAHHVITEMGQLPSIVAQGRAAPDVQGEPAGVARNGARSARSQPHS